jgi:DNA-binding transcriptional LysR family regulator
MIDVRRLRVLREVAVAGTVSGAARALGYTPSAVSQQLAALARESGAELLRRRGRHVELTAEGRLLVELAERVGAELEAAEAELAARAAQPGGVVRLLAFATALQTLVPRAVAQLARTAPGLQLEIDEADPDDALRLLVQERADVVVAHDYDLLERRRSARVHRRELFDDELRLVGAVEPGRDAVALASLADRRWVLPDRGSACDRVVERACAAAGFAPDVVARSSDFAAIVALADACDAVALVPRIALRGDAPAIGAPAPDAPGSPASAARGTPAPDAPGSPALAAPHTHPPAPAGRPLTQPVGRQVFAAVRDGAQRRPLEARVLDALTSVSEPPRVKAGRPNADR